MVMKLHNTDQDLAPDYCPKYFNAHEKLGAFKNQSFLCLPTYVRQEMWKNSSRKMDSVLAAL